MKIGGFVKQNLSDYPGKLVCIVFTTGCNQYKVYMDLEIAEIIDKVPVEFPLLS